MSKRRSKPGVPTCIACWIKHHTGPVPHRQSGAVERCHYCGESTVMGLRTEEVPSDTG